MAMNDNKKKTKYYRHESRTVRACIFGCNSRKDKDFLARRTRRTMSKKYVVLTQKCAKYARSKLRGLGM